MTSFQFLSLNLWPVADLFDRIVDFLQSERPDVLFLQEVFNGTATHLAPKYRAFSELQSILKYPYAEFAAAFYETDVPGIDRVDQGNAIMSRFPLQSLEPIFFDVPYGGRENTPSGFPWTPRNLQRVTAQIGDQKVHLFNTQGIWGTDGKDSKRRLQMSQDIVAQVKGKSPVILAGDFNVQSHTQTIDQIESELTNVFKDELVTTFNMKQKTSPGYATAVVDMVFTSSDIKVLSHSCPAVDISDHLPLRCEFQIE